jgi:hypothetical protein
MKRRIAALAVAAGCAVAAARTVGPVMAATAAAAPAAGPRLLPMATSWPTPQRGIVLGYPSRTAGARPSLLFTANGGRTWRSLPSPPVAYPADNDQPDAAFADGVIVVQDGSRIVITHDQGRRWAAERVAGVSGRRYVSGIAIGRGRVFALVTTGTTTALYDGPVAGDVLRAVRGLSITGPHTYGDISAAGGLQVDLGSAGGRGRYWYSRDGARWAAAPRPCAMAASVLLGAVRAGRVLALCSGSPSDIGLGQNDKRVWAAARLGGVFRPSGPALDSANQQGFAAASAADLTISTTFALYDSVNAGRTWRAELIKPNGASFSDLAFPSAAVGVVVVNSVTDAGREVGAVDRTTDGGRVWRALPLP